MPSDSESLYRAVPRESAHRIEFAKQIHKNRGRVPRFLYSEREKSFCIGTFLRPCFAKSKHRLSEKRQFFDSLSPAAGRSFGSGNSAETGPADSAGTGSAFPDTDCVS